MGVKVRQKAGSPYWWVFVLHNGKRTSKIAQDQREANKLAKEIRQALAVEDLGLTKQEDEPPPVLTFGRYADNYLANARQTLKRSTWIDYDGNVRLYLKPAFEDYALEKITRAEIKRLAMEIRGKGKKAKTAKKVIGTLSAILSEALDDNLITSNPALGLRKLYRSPDFSAGGLSKDVNPLTRDELTHLLTTAQNHSVRRGAEIEYPFRRAYPFLLLLARTGLRLGEALALKWGDIDWRGSFIEVQRAFVRSRLTTPKNGKSRRVDMSAQLLETLRAIYDERFEKVVGITPGTHATLASQRAAGLGEWVFPNDCGNIMDPDKFRRTTFADLLTAAKMRHIRIHDLRHTYASLLIQACKELHYIQQQLGHHSPAFTLAVYGHLLPRDRRGEVNCLDDVGAHVAGSSAALCDRIAS